MGLRRRLRSLLTVAIFVTGILFTSVPATAAVPCFPGWYQCPTQYPPFYCNGWQPPCL